MRKIAVVDTFKEAEDLAAELMASGHYEDASIMKDGGVYEVWVEDKD